EREHLDRKLALHVARINLSGTLDSTCLCLRKGARNRSETGFRSGTADSITGEFSASGLNLDRLGRIVLLPMAGWHTDVKPIQAAPHELRFREVCSRISG